MAETKGIGRLIDLCIEALETNSVSKMARKRIATAGPKKGQEVSLWDSELAGHRQAEPAPRGPRPVGSFNFGPVANLCELILSKGADSRAAGWLEAYYRRQGPNGDLGHMGWEALSHVYGAPLIEAALLTVAAHRRLFTGQPSSRAEWTMNSAAMAADRLLSRELALCLLHRAPGGRIIHAGTRSKMKGAGLSSPAREDFVEMALWASHGGARPGRIRRLMKLSNWSAPLALHDAGKSSDHGAGGGVHPDHLQPYLSEIRFAPGPLVVTHYGNGHVSRFETGPVCYQSPMPANVVRYEPWEVWPVLLEGKGGTKQNPGRRGMKTVRDPHDIWVFWEELGKERMTRIEYDFGAVVAEHRIEGISL